MTIRESLMRSRSTLILYADIKKLCASWKKLNTIFRIFNTLIKELKSILKEPRLEKNEKIQFRHSNSLNSKNFSVFGKNDIYATNLLNG